MANVLNSADRYRGPDGAALREPESAPSLGPLHVQLDVEAEDLTVTITVIWDLYELQCSCPC